MLKKNYESDRSPNKVSSRSAYSKSCGKYKKKPFWIREITIRERFAVFEGLPNVSHLVAFEITFFARMVFPFESCTPTCHILQNISSTFK